MYLTNRVNLPFEKWGGPLLMGLFPRQKKGVGPLSLSPLYYKASVLIVTFFVDDISAFHDNLSRIFSMFCDIFKLRNFIVISDFRVTIFKFWRCLVMYQITDDCTKLSSRLWTIFNLFTLHIIFWIQFSKILFHLYPKESHTVPFSKFNRSELLFFTNVWLLPVTY